MRVTSSTYYKEYAKTVQDLHSELNKSMQQVSSGRKFDSAEEDPLAYYSGKKLDNLYTDAATKNTVISDVNNRMYQQEQGTLAIQTTMRSVNTNMLRLANESTTSEPTTIRTINSDFQQRLQSMANNLNATYENYYVFGGNDPSTVPFTLDPELSGDQPSYTLNFAHKFPGESDTTTTMSIKYTLQDDGELKVDYSGKRVQYDDYGKVIAGTEETLDEDQTLDYILSAMREQGRMSLGYGNLENQITLPDTFTGGLNMLTGLKSEGLKSLDDASAKEQIKLQMTQTPVALTTKAVLTVDRYLKTADDSASTASERSNAKSNMVRDIGQVIGKWDASEQRLSESYRELGIKQSVLKDTQTALGITEDTLTSQYKDKLGIDPYDAITKMYSQQYSYQAAMKVGSNIMQSSLFDYVKG